jgi:hypothetical protein
MGFAELEYWTRAVRDYGRGLAGGGGETELDVE